MSIPLLEKHPHLGVSSFEAAVRLMTEPTSEIAVINSPSMPHLELEKFVDVSLVSDIVVVGDGVRLLPRLLSALNDAGLKPPTIREDFANSLYREVTEFMRTYFLEEIELQFQFRSMNIQPWHTDGNGIPDDKNRPTINYGKTIIGKRGTHCVLGQEINREEYLSLITQMDNENNVDIGLALSTVKDGLCEARPVYEIPVGCPFLFRTTRRSGLIHRPPSGSENRLFVKARGRTGLTSVYLSTYGHPTGEVGAKRYELIWGEEKGA